MRLRARMRMLESPGWTYKTIVPTITKNALRGDSGTAKKVGADGHIVQRGSHAELVAQDGLYRTLYDLQQGTESK